MLVTFLITVTESLSEATYRRKDLFSFMVWRVQSIVAGKEWRQEHLGLRWRDPGTADMKHRAQTWSEAMLQPSKFYTHTCTHAHIMIHLISRPKGFITFQNRATSWGPSAQVCACEGVLYSDRQSTPALVLSPGILMVCLLPFGFCNSTHPDVSRVSEQCC